METMQGALKNGRNVWDPIDMPAAEFEGRIARVREAMKAAGLDLMLVYGFGFNRYADPAYLTNFMLRLPRGALIALSAEGQPVLFFEGGSRGIPSLRKTMYECEMVAASDNAKECVKYLKDKGLLPCRVGLSGLRDSMPHSQLGLLSEALAGSTVSDAGHILAEMRTVKSARELDQIRRAARIVRRVFEAVPGLALPESEKAFAARLYREARLEGAEDVRILLGRKAGDLLYLRPAGDGRPGAGELVVVYAAVEFERYWAEGARTYRVEGGTAAPVDDPEGAYMEAAACARPGTEASALRASIGQIAGRHGLGLAADYGLANGIGLATHEAPFIDGAGGTRLAAGMALAMRLVCAAGESRLMRAGTLIVTEGAPEILI